MPFSHMDLILWVLFRIILKMGCMLTQGESIFCFNALPTYFFVRIFFSYQSR